MARRGRRRPRGSNAVIGLMAVVLAAVVMFFGFTKDVPFTSGFQVRAQFESANSIRPNSPVRIAGVEVGKVKAVEGMEGSNGAVLVLELDDAALPLHEDATAKIRPRIFLEGNFFVDLKPGTPAARELDSGETIKITQTATPVQLDEVLTSLQSDSREDLQGVLEGLNATLNSEPTAEQDAESSPLARGQTAAESFNDALDDIPAAERSTAQVLEALLGTAARPRRRAADPRHGQHRRRARPLRERAQGPDHQPQRHDGDVRRRVGQPAGLDPRAAADAARRQRRVRLAQRRLPADARLRHRDPARACARRRPRSTPRSRGSSRCTRWSARTSSAGWPRSSRPRAPTWRGSWTARPSCCRRPTWPPSACATSCCRRATSSINDEFTTGEENYKEFFYALVGLAGEGQNFDGNGMYVRFQTGGGSQSVSLGSQSSTTGQLFGNNPEVPLGNRPAYPGKRPPYKPEEPCYQQQIPDVNGPAAAKSLPTGAPATAQVKSLRDKLRKEADLNAVRKKLEPVRLGQEGRRGARAGEGQVRMAIRKHLPDFLAILGLLVIAIAVATVILGKQRLALPAWVPVVGQRLLRARGRDGDGAGRHAGPGPDGQRRRRRGGRDQLGQAARRQGDHRHEARSRATRRSTRTRRSCCGPRPA